MGHAKTFIMSNLLVEGLMIGALPQGALVVDGPGPAIPGGMGMSNTPSESGQRRERFLFLGSGLLLLTVVLLGFAKAQRWGTSFVDVYIKARDVNGITRGEDIRIAGLLLARWETYASTKKDESACAAAHRADKAYLIGPRSKAHLAQDGLMGDPSW